MKKIISSGSRKLGLLFLLLVAFATNSANAQTCWDSTTSSRAVCVNGQITWTNRTVGGTPGEPITWTITDTTGGATFLVNGGVTYTTTLAPVGLDGFSTNTIVVVAGPNIGAINVEMVYNLNPTATFCSTSAFAVAPVVVGIPPILECPGDTGTITVDLTRTGILLTAGGTPVPAGVPPFNFGPYTYTLNPVGTSNTTGIFPGLGAGTYTITISDGSTGGCSATSAPIVIEPVAPRPLILTCPPLVERDACASEAELAFAFHDWMELFQFTGGFPPTITSTNPEGPVAPNHCGGETTVTWTVRDNCGYTDSCTATFRVRPSLPPVIECPPGGDLGCNPETIPGPTAPTITSACPTLPYTYEDVRDFDGCYVTLTRTYTVTNECQQSDTCDQVFTWKEDHNVPTLLCPVGGDLGCNPEVIPGPGTAQYSDDCPGELTLDIDTLPIVIDGCYRSQTYRFSVTDECENRNQCDQTYTWKVDTTAPVVTCPGDRVLGCNVPTPTPEVATANDECDGSLPVTASVGPITEDGCLRRLTITYSAEDACENVGSCQQTFTWTVDLINPVIVLDPAPSLGVDPTLAEILAALGTAHIDDACGATIEFTDGPVVETAPCAFSQTRTWTGIDGCLNRAADVDRTVTWTTSGCAEPNGCTLGYWKNHTLAWDCYTTCTLYKSVFSGSTLDPNLTLLQALNLGSGGCNNLARQSVAALLNICDGTLDYSVADIAALQTLVNEAFANGTCGAAGSLLDGFNNEGGANHCDVAKSKNTSQSTCTSSKGSTQKGVNATGNVAPSNTTFKAYPNPFTNNFSIKSSNTDNPLEISIFDNLGRSIETQTVNPSEFDFTSFGSGYPTGIYNIIFNQATEQKTLRVIKQ